MALEPRGVKTTETPVQSLVSIVVIFLNEAKFIEEAIASVLAQTYSNWELILVDDGSTDDSSAISKNYAAKFPQRVKYLEHREHQNLGMSASRNLGINNSRGEYIAFLDGDDVWLADKLEQQVAIMETQTDAAFVCGRTQWWYSWAKDGDRQRDFIQQLDLPLNSLVPPPAILLLFLQNEWASLHDILIRQKAIATVGGYEDSFKGMYEDQVFHAKLCLNFPAYVADRCWCRYRQHSQACTFQTHDTDRGYFIARKTFLIWLANYLSQQQVQNTEISAIVKQELWHYQYPLLSRIISRLSRLKKDLKYLIGRS